MQFNDKGIRPPEGPARISLSLLVGPGPSYLEDRNEKEQTANGGPSQKRFVSLAYGRPFMGLELGLDWQSAKVCLDFVVNDGKGIDAARYILQVPFQDTGVISWVARRPCGICLLRSATMQ